MGMSTPIEIGDQTYVTDGGDPFGAVRDVTARDLTIYVENAGDFVIPRVAVAAVHSHKVILDPELLEPRCRAAIARAHDSEEPGL
jgi:hypothetical protein